MANPKALNDYELDANLEAGLENKIDILNEEIVTTKFKSRVSGLIDVAAARNGRKRTPSAISIRSKASIKDLPRKLARKCRSHLKKVNPRDKLTIS